MIKPICFIAAFFGVSCSNWADAACGKGSKTVFHCLTDKGKAIEVCDFGKTLEYSFGKPDKRPEISLRVPRNEVSTHQWHGAGDYIYYDIEIPNRDIIYSVYSCVNRTIENASFEAGVEAKTINKNLATIKCAEKEQDVIDAIAGIDLKPEE
jgi:hypothetical protein